MAFRCKDCKHDKGRCAGSARRGPHQYCFEPKVMTNADRIRAMTNEELADFMAERNVSESCLRLKDEGYAPTEVQRQALKNRLYIIWIQWLRQPVEGE